MSENEVDLDFFRRNFQQYQQPQQQQQKHIESNTSNIIITLGVQNNSHHGDGNSNSSNEDDEIIYGISSCQAFKWNFIMEVIFWFVCIASLGSLLLLCKWINWLKLYLTCVKISTTFKQADFLLIESNCSIHGMDGSFGRYTVVPICRDLEREFNVKFIKFRTVSFVYCEERDGFIPCRFNIGNNFNQLHEKIDQFVENQNLSKFHKLLNQIFGKNIIETPVKPIFSLLVDEVFHPFYIFQIVSVVIWCMIDYWIYALAIAFISTLSCLINLHSTRQSMVKLREMTGNQVIQLNRVKLSQDQAISQPNSIHKYHIDKRERVSSSELIPGDFVEIENGMNVPCDMILMSGQVIVNESIMTGESTPVKKMHIPNKSNHFHQHGEISNIFEGHTLYAGTNVIMIKHQVIGMVINTGFQTMKGKLIIPIIYSKPSNFQLYRDSFKYMIIMFFFGCAGVAGTFINLYNIHVPIPRIFLECFVLMTIVIPPALPIAIATTLSFAIYRLRFWNIFCIAPQRISLSGIVKKLVFDKTNTLTCDHLELHHVIQSNHLDTNSGELLENPNSPVGDIMHWAMSTCHELTLLQNGQLVGDPLDIKIFEATPFKFIEDHPTSGHSQVQSENEETSFEILKIFPFKSSLQRMSVIVKHQSGKIFCFTKGSGEMIKQLCDNSQSVPFDFYQTLYSNSHKGYRVIGVAFRELFIDDLEMIQTIDRNQVECDLKFIGLICLENKLKKETPQVIKKLLKCNLDVVIASGDNPFTVTSVARQIGLMTSEKIYLGELDLSRTNENWMNSLVWRNVDSEKDIITTEQLIEESHLYANLVEFALTGPVFNYILQHASDCTISINNQLELSFIKFILMNCKIYSRFSPQDKMKLVEILQNDLKYSCLMCGDGQNDIKALKLAHVGVSLSSDQEASLAAPFTSLKPSIECVLSVLREGRCALWSSFQVFKYMSLYCLIQFYTVVILFQKNTKMSDFQYLFVDLFIALPTLLLMTRTKSTNQLKRKKPPTTLFSKQVLLSWFSQIFLSFLTILLVWIEIHSGKFNWITLLDHPSEDVTQNYLSYESTIMFFMSTLCTINCCISFSISKPYKKSLWSCNIMYICCLVAIYLYTCYVILIPAQVWKSIFLLVNMPMFYKIRILIYGMIHLIISYGIEYILVADSFLKILKKLNLVNILKVVKSFGLENNVTINGWIKYLNSREKPYRQYRKLFKRE
ncbi:predicted protein [Naegleria gruberi]|uniref:Cation-transporting ATPase n=1 Tax=Naegleria gruberi TaxID=5762 RepID=D2VAD2_NAEGR|nr:uncharacterized protein NAEGRDRAFT_79203 [Naegleria gruberi]EFC46286.1 predicted protein [Naegleria gruberi]|eukprot:XP_002679030.1 predicted protein [Naegleria gruberi strain NEG-M]